MRFLRDALITLLALVVVVFVATYVRVQGGGLSAEDEPGRLERTVANRLVRLAIPPDAAHLTSPRAAPSRWREAADVFGDHCARCHGADGRGHTDLGENMYPKAPDLAGPSVQQLSDGALFYVIQNGVRWTGVAEGAHARRYVGPGRVHPPRAEPDVRRARVVVITDRARARARAGPGAPARPSLTAYRAW
jgi:cytochrome c553